MDAESSSGVKISVRIPVLVSRTGEVHSGYFDLLADGTEASGYDICYDSMSDESYKAGCAVVYVTAEIDKDELFRQFELRGAVEVK